jgi:hypothetical protein
MLTPVWVVELWAINECESPLPDTVTTLYDQGALHKVIARQVGKAKYTRIAGDERRKTMRF